MKKYTILFLFILFYPFYSFGTENIFMNDNLKQNYNVILITVDALRADHLSCYGYFRKTSLNIDMLTEEGILFKNAFSQSTYTTPSMASIYTSLYPQSHGVAYQLRDILPSKIKMLPEILNDSGYKTARFTHVTDPGMAKRNGRFI